MNDDAELLRRDAEEGSEADFADWVQRHIGLVYAAACRRLDGDAHGAADVAQRVFLTAAREAPTLARHTSVTGWLYMTTRNAALNLRREEQRRRQREREAFLAGEIFSADAAEGSCDWEQLRPVLDAAMDDLGETDREAVLLRLFEGRAFAEVGQRLRLSENSARMRVARALAKLHVVLARRGVTSTASALGVMLAKQAGAATSAAAVPVGLAGSVASAALTGATAVATGGGLAFGVLNFMSTTKAMLAAGGALAICASVGTAAWQYRETTAARAEADADQRGLAALIARSREAQQRADAAEREAREWAAKRAAPRAIGSAASTPPPPAPGAWEPLREGRAMMARNPELKDAVRARIDAGTRLKSDPLFRELGFTPVQIEEFLELQREQASLDEAEGPHGRSLAFSAGTDLPQADYRARLQALLGEATS